MMAFDTSRSYSSLSKIFHLIFIFLFLPQLTGGFLLSKIPKSLKASAYMTHKAMGVLLLWLFLARIMNVFMQVRRPQIIATPTLNKAVRLVIYLLYTAMLIMPISGWIMSSIAKKAPYIPFIGNWYFPVPRWKWLGGLMHEIHHFFAYIAAAVVLLHIANFLYLHYIKKFRVSDRMFKF